MRVTVLLVALGVITASLGQELLGYSPSPASSPTPASASSRASSPVDVRRSEHRRPHREHHGPLGEADGAVPEGTTVFDDEVPGVTNLDPALLGALRQAATDASDAGVKFVVNSGWRSPAYEDQLRRQAIAEYGSEAEAARWVATGTTSPHVSGDAVDIGPAAATQWLSAHGAAYGLCQIYANEPWHYELRPEASDQGCPAMYADPTHDPRMQQR
jgi:D-alanyl-D-alanine carboxypeptidase